jgi:hypothetical protein
LKFEHVNIRAENSLIINQLVWKFSILGVKSISVSKFCKRL